MTEPTILYPPTPAGSEARNRHYLHPGQVACFSEPTSITTILGSCVAICLWDPLTAVGGMNHYLLPGHAVEDMATPRYGHVAFKVLLKEVMARGARAPSLQAKIFGGATLHGLGGGELGRCNIELACTLLAVAGIPIMSRDVGGREGRKVVFQTDDGTVWVRKLGTAPEKPS